MNPSTALLTDREPIAESIQRFRDADDRQRAEWLAELESTSEEVATRLQQLIVAIGRDLLSQPFDATLEPGQWVDAMAACYAKFPADSAVRQWVLILMNRGDSPRFTPVIAEIMASDPPQHPDAAAAVISLWMQRPPADPAQLYPRLLDGIVHRSTAAPILDVTNFFFRSGRLDEHPAAPKRRELATLLSGIVGELKELSAAGTDDAQSQVARRIDDAVALSIAICETLGHVGGDAERDVLQAAMELTHRRIRVSAAAALAKLGEDEGKQVLVGLASEPVVRLYAIEFAKELGLLEEIDPKFRSAQSIAESKLALYLAQPVNFGMPPTRMEVVDERTLFWPGFDDPQAMFLIRYKFQVGAATFANLAISGAEVASSGADLTDLSVDDCFALFAGAGIAHEEVFEVAAEEFNSAHRLEADRLAVQLRASGYDNFRPQYLCFFFDEISLAGEAEKDGEPCVAIAGPHGVLSRAIGNPDRPIRAGEIIAIQRGHAALRTFNLEDADHAETPDD